MLSRIKAPAGEGMARRGGAKCKAKLWVPPQLASSATIAAFHRSDSSGTTDNFTKFLAATAPSTWTFGNAKDWKAPGGQGSKGSDGVASSVKATANSIGYMELSFAQDAKLTTASVDNGAKVINLLPEQKPDPALRKFAPHIVLGLTDDMQLSQREIFGPILPIRTYGDPDEVVRYINAHDRPLAIYPFTHDQALQQMYIERVMSGGVSVNEAMMHVAQHDMPFGGVGASGMGHYHGYEGFLTFSKLRPVFKQSPWRSINMLMPPYKGFTAKVLETLGKDARVERIQTTRP